MNRIANYLQKEPVLFTAKDLEKFIVENNIEFLNFRYIADDGHLKTLNFYLHSREYLRKILTYGERIDGSSIFKYIDSTSSDLYVIPIYHTAFVNPFSEIPAVDIICTLYDKNYEPLKSSPDQIIKKAKYHLKKITGYDIKILGELEFYIVAPRIEKYEIVNKKGYHETSPFIKFNEFRKKAMKLICECGGKIKYGHSEVGCFVYDNKLYEQHEIEFLPEYAEVAALNLIISKWILRELAFRENIIISFAPKITIDKAGSGLHFHFYLEENGKNVIISNNELNDNAKKAIAGILYNADALCAFGNTIPLSYLRLMPDQEAPTRICWGESNRTALIRIPLGWCSSKDMVAEVNGINNQDFIPSIHQTIEYRGADGTSDIYHIISAIMIAIAYGFTMQNAIEFANSLYIKGNPDTIRNTELISLPYSCYEAAIALEKKRKIFEVDNIFPEGLINSIITKLKSYNDQNFRKMILNNEINLSSIVEEFLHYN
ncbi:MAG: glutamine synthetase family protein [Bacteroidales bacterium]|nr:glutamine synthetase family protein [Bacteroidales bacterium]